MIDKLEKRYDPPVTRNKNGDPNGINLHFLAELAAYTLPLKFIPEEACYYHYSQEYSLWEPAADDDVKEKLKDFLFNYRNYFRIKGMDQLVTIAAITTIMQFMRPHMREERFFYPDSDVSKTVVHVQNGFLQPGANNSCWYLVDADDTTKREFRSRHRFNVAFAPIETCPQFMRFLQDAGLDEDAQRVMQLYFGQVLLGPNRSQTILLINGEGGSGKSTLLAILREIIGDESIAVMPYGGLGDRFTNQAFVGKRLLIGADVKPDFLMTKGGNTLKSLIGGDPIRVEAKGSNSIFNIDGTFSGTLVSNQRLRLRVEGDHEAWRRRLLSITFSKKRDASCPVNPNLAKEMLANESSGILNWMLTGALELLQNNGIIQKSKKQQQAVNDIVDESDSVNVFCEQILSKGNNSDTVSCDELQTAYATYCINRVWRPLPKREAGLQFGKNLLSLFRVTQATDIFRDGGNKRGYRRIRINNLKLKEKA
ncbi:MAG: phage/plasmid primase, P4 family [Lentisphaeria bacterium]